MGLIVERTKEIQEKYTGQAIGFYNSGQLFLEEYYTLSIMGDADIGTYHMDGNTRLCTATAAMALMESFETDGDPGSYNDFGLTSTILMVGHNMANTQTVLWTRILDRDGNEQGFKIERCTGVGCSDFAQIATVGATVTSYSNTGLTASTSYSYRVRAYNAVGDSDYSNPAGAVTLDAPALPAVPTNLVATVISKSQINLTWTDNATNETGYRIERCKGATCTNFALVATVGANVTSYSNTKLTANTTYRNRVYAYNSSGNSGYLNIAAATTPRR